MKPGRRNFNLALAAVGSLMCATRGGEALAQAATADAPARRSFKTSDGVTLSYLETAPPGAAGALNIVLVPGWCMPAAIWRPQFATLGARYRTIAFDPRGQGESEVAQAGYTAKRRAADLHECIAAAVPARSKVLLTGWSLAALEALEYVFLHGDRRLAGLALIDSSVGELPVPPGGGGSPTSDSPFKQRLRRERARMLEEFVRAIFANPPPAEELKALAEAAQRMPVEDSIALLSYPYPREHWKEVAHAFKKPLLYAVTPQFAAQAGNLKKNRPATRIEVFQKAGHALFADEPDRFNQLILNFASSL